MFVHQHTGCDWISTATVRYGTPHKVETLPTGGCLSGENIARITKSM